MKKLIDENNLEASGYISRAPGQVKYRRITRRKDGKSQYFVDVTDGDWIWLSKRDTAIKMFEYNGELVDKNLKPITKYRNINGKTDVAQSQLKTAFQDEEAAAAFLSSTRLRKLALLLPDEPS